MTRLITLIFLLGFLITGCGSSKNEESTAPEKINKSAPPKAEEDIPAESPNIVYPLDWSEVIVNANYAKTLVTTAAHFNTSRNACGKEAYGPIDLEAWNGFTKNLNEAIPQISIQPETTTPTPTSTATPTGNSASEYCVAPPADEQRYMNDSVQVKLSGKTIQLFEYKMLEDGEKICSKIKDHALSDRLLSYVNKIIILADKEDCPNGWGSALR